MKNNLLAGAIALASCVPASASAQDRTPEPPEASRQLTFQSAFTNYKPYQDVPLGNWRQLNDSVSSGSGEPGSHAGHSMSGMPGMEMPKAPAASASAPAPMKPMHMHGGDHLQEGKP